MSRRSGWTLFLATVLVALLAPATADKVVLVPTKCSQCETDLSICEESNEDYQKGFTDCIKLNDCTPHHTKCDAMCMHACATCRSYWGYLLTTCNDAHVSCRRSCMAE